MARELRELAGYLVLSLLLVGSAEFAVAIFDVPRLWALIVAFTLGYTVVAVVKWRSRTEHAPPVDEVRPDSPSTKDSRSKASSHDAPPRY